MFSILEKKVMQVNPNTFEDLALEVFRFQARENLIFHKYLQLLKIKVADINTISQIPFLPVSCYKYHRITSGDWKEEDTFYSIIINIEEYIQIGKKITLLFKETDLLGMKTSF